MKKRAKNIIFVIFTLFISLLFMEISLQILSITSSTVNQVLSPQASQNLNVVINERLGKRPKPNLPGHDKHGFRNKTVPSKSDIVALGDSQTYGTHVKAKNTWPHQLGETSGSTVYNMAFGGYGPTHSLTLWPEAIEFKPAVIIEAFYFGNDLFDSFNHVYNLGQWEELKTTDSALLESINKFESQKPILNLASEAYNFGMSPSGSKKTGIKNFTRNNLKLYAFFQSAKHILINKIKNTPDNWLLWQMAKTFAWLNKEYCQPFSSSYGKTILTSKYRLIALNQKDPRIEEGLEISLKAIKKMNDFAKKGGIKYMVLLIPTKELVFKNLVELDKAYIRNDFDILITNEELAREKAAIFFQKQNIDYIDSLPALRSQLLSGESPYRSIPDGHPNRYGHKAIADLIQSFIESYK